MKRVSSVPPVVSRRQLMVIAGVALTGALVALALMWWDARSGPGADTMVVYKRPTCACCAKWVEHVEAAGFEVTVRGEPALTTRGEQFGIPKRLAACHTAFIGGYVIEGHVPVKDIQRLLLERPAAKGLAVPGMPIGSPGMDAYATLLFQPDGQTTIFANHGGISP